MNRRKVTIKTTEITSYLTCEEVSEYLKLRRSTIYEWARAGQIPCYKVGRIYRFRLHEIDKWIDRKKQKNRLPEGPILKQ